MSNTRGDIELLKVKIQTLETKNKALREPSESSSVARLDHYFQARDQLDNREIEKLGLGYENGQSSIQSNHSQSQNPQGELTQMFDNEKFAKLKFDNNEYDRFQSNKATTFDPN